MINKLFFKILNLIAWIFVILSVLFITTFFVMQISEAVHDKKCDNTGVTILDNTRYMN